MLPNCLLGRAPVPCLRLGAGSGALRPHQGGGEVVRPRDLAEQTPQVRHRHLPHRGKYAADRAEQDNARPTPRHPVAPGRRSRQDAVGTRQCRPVLGARGVLAKLQQPAGGRAGKGPARNSLKPYSSSPDIYSCTVLPAADRSDSSTLGSKTSSGRITGQTRTPAERPSTASRLTPRRAPARTAAAAGRRRPQ